MREPTMSLAIAVLLTTDDFEVFERNCRESWRAWPGPLWVLATLLLLLTFWGASVAVLWIRVNFDLCQTTREHQVVEITSTFGRLRGKLDV